MYRSVESYPLPDEKEALEFATLHNEMVASALNSLQSLKTRGVKMSVEEYQVQVVELVTMDVNHKLDSASKPHVTTEDIKNIVRVPINQFPQIYLYG